MTAGQSVVLSTVQGGTYEIRRPDGTTVAGALDLGAATASQAGRYTFTTAAGCTATLDLTVNAAPTGGCPAGSLVPRYTVDGTSASGSGALTVTAGQSVVLSTVQGGTYEIRRPDGTTVAGALDLGAATASQAGRYTFTTAAGCTATLDLTVNAAPTGSCPPGSIIPEYRLNGVWLSGQNDLTVAVGTSVMLSMLPNGIGVTVTLPNGTVRGDNYGISSATAAHSGAYVLTSAQGCQTTINLTVGSVVSCPAGSLVPRYTVDGTSASGSGALTVTAGQSVVLSTVQGGTYEIRRPDGTTVAGALDLGAATASQAGRYTFTTAAGCTATLDLTVNAAPTGGCPAGSLVPRYTVDGTSASGSGALTVTAGQSVVLSTVQGGTYEIRRPDGTTVAGALDLGAATASQAGRYTFTTAAGCTATLDLTVNAAPTGSCPPGSIIPEYRLNGVWLSGQNDLTVAVGTSVMLSMLPNGIGVTVTLPNGTVRGDNYGISSATAAHSGAYVLTSAQGCQTTINLTVGSVVSCPAGSLVPRYTVDGTSASGSGALTVTAGQSVVLSTVQGGTYEIRRPDGTTVAGALDLGAATASQAGRYTFTTAAGCTATLDLTVNAAPTGSCPPGSIIPEYRLNGVWLSGQNNVNVAVGTSVMLSMLPNGIGVTVTLPNGTVRGDNYGISSATAAHSGAYVLTSAQGCQTTINLTVGSGLTAKLAGDNGSNAFNSNIEVLTDIDVFPNPTPGVVQINMGNYMGAPVELNVFNSVQQSVLTKKFAGDHRAEEEIDLTGLSSGQYYFIFTGAPGKIVKTVILAN